MDAIMEEQPAAPAALRPSAPTPQVGPVANAHPAAPAYVQQEGPQAPIAPGAVIMEAVPGQRVPDPYAVPGNTSRAVKAVTRKVTTRWYTTPTGERRWLKALMVAVLALGLLGGYTYKVVLDHHAQVAVTQELARQMTAAKAAAAKQATELQRQLTEAQRPWWKFWE
jgi:hypothetical protein